MNIDSASIKEISPNSILVLTFQLIFKTDICILRIWNTLLNLDRNHNLKEITGSRDMKDQSVGLRKLEKLGAFYFVAKPKTKA